MREWLNRLDSKSSDAPKGCPWVRIPLSPPLYPPPVLSFRFVMSVSIHDVEHALEFDDIRERVGRECRSAQGRNVLLKLGPFRKRADAESELDAVQEMRRLLSNGVSLPFFAAIGSDVLQRLGLTGAVLAAEALCDLRATLRNIKELKDARAAGYLVELERLCQEVDELAFDEVLLRELERVLDDDGTVKESASPELRSARKRQKELERSINSSLEKMMRSENNKECFGDTYVTTINSRFVIPVYADFKGRIGGVVQGTSGSGHSVFLEPFKVVDMNNDLLEARAKEKAEITRLLLALSDKARENLRGLKEANRSLAWLDSLHARAVYANITNSTRVVFTDDGTLSLKRARHPLLEGECVPMSIDVSEKERVIVLSGANSGGKTVTLKTVGLCALMARCGYHVLAEEGTKVPFFKRIFVDIGDQQSIVEHLSSFSSHAKSVAKIMARTKRGDLVLLDELMSGTDPEEGAALAEAVVEELGKRGAVVVTTTHFGGLKVLSQQSKMFKNCAVEFDDDTYKPTYHLISDMPGASYGFEIARRFGIAPDIVQRAQEIIGGGRHRLTELIEDLEQELRRVREAGEQRETELRKIENLRKDLELKDRTFKEKRHEELTKELEETRQSMLDFRKTVDGQMKALVERGQALSKDELKEEARSIVRSVDVQLKKCVPPQAQVEKPDRPLAVGDRVKIEASTMTGRITDIYPNKNKVRVDVSGMILSVRMDEVSHVDSGSSKKAPGKSKKKKSSFSGLNVRTTYESELPYELDLRGKRAHEAVEELERYLDLAIARNVEILRIIHGKGTGTLRREVERILRQSPAVKKFRAGGEGEGDFGVTVATLR